MIERLLHEGEGEGQRQGREGVRLGGVHGDEDGLRLWFLEDRLFIFVTSAAVGGLEDERRAAAAATLPPHHHASITGIVIITIPP